MKTIKHISIFAIALLFIPVLGAMYLTTFLKIVFDYLSAWTTALVMFTFSRLTIWVGKP